MERLQCWQYAEIGTKGVSNRKDLCGRRLSEENDFGYIKLVKKFSFKFSMEKKLCDFLKNELHERLVSIPKEDLEFLNKSTIFAMNLIH